MVLDRNGRDFWRLGGPKSRLEVKETLEVVSEADERPFELDLGQAAQREPAEPEGLLDDPEDRLDGLLALLVAEPTGFGGDAMGQVFEERGLRRWRGRVVALFQLRHGASVGIAFHRR